MWETKYYDLLQNTVAGGKGKMKYHFSNNAWNVATKDGPVAEGGRDALVDALQVGGKRGKGKSWEGWEEGELAREGREGKEGMDGYVRQAGG